MSATDPCLEDLSQLSIDDAFNVVNQCAKQVYQDLLKTAAFDVVNRVLSSLASQLASMNPQFKVVETPRRVEFTSRLDAHRYAPYPIIALTAPTTPEGYDLPIRYDSIPSIVVDPRKVAVGYADSAKELIERAKRYITIVEFWDGSSKSYPLELTSDVSLILSFNGYTYRMSYDKDYPAAEPPEIYIEGFEYVAGDTVAGTWQVTVIEANVIGYKTTSGEYYSGYGGVVIGVSNAGVLRKVRIIGRELNVSSYASLVIVFSNVFSLWAYILQS